MGKFLGVLLLLIAASSYASDWAPPDFNSCVFYEKAEAEVHCKGRGSDYLIGYGQYYCNAFRTKLPEWKGRPKLTEWTTNTGMCLQEMLFDNRKKRLGPDCNQLEEFAFDAHPICYKQYGICKLSISDEYAIFDVVKLIHLVTRRSVAQIDNVILACLGDWLSPEEKASYNQVFLGTESQPETTRRLAISLFEKAPSDSKESRRNYFKKLLPEVTFNSSSKTALMASQEFLTQFRSDGTTASAAINQSANDCLNVFTTGGAETARCDTRVRKELRKLRLKDQTVVRQNSLSKERIEEIMIKMGSIKNL